VKTSMASFSRMGQEEAHVRGGPVPVSRARNGSEPTTAVREKCRSRVVYVRHRESREDMIQNNL
jgi:hypothetical protein